MQLLMNRHPHNIIMLGLFTVMFSVMVGVSCVFSKGNEDISMSFRFDSVLIFIE